MQYRNSAEHFGLVSIALHWLMAFLLLILLLMGLYMTRLPLSPQQLSLFRWHKEIGMLVLFLALLRLLWRFSNAVPSLGTLPRWESLAARSVHWIFYLLMLLLPLSGWLLSSAAGISVSFFGWFVFPDLLTASENQRLLLTETHEVLAYFLIALLCLHAAAALKHELINRDTILRRMLWP